MNLNIPVRRMYEKSISPPTKPALRKGDYVLVRGRVRREEEEERKRKEREVAEEERKRRLRLLEEKRMRWRRCEEARRMRRMDMWRRDEEEEEEERRKKIGREGREEKREGRWKKWHEEEEERRKIGREGKRVGGWKKWEEEEEEEERRKKIGREGREEKKLRWKRMNEEEEEEEARKKVDKEEKRSALGQRRREAFMRGMKKNVDDVRGRRRVGRMSEEEEEEEEGRRGRMVQMVSPVRILSSSADIPRGPRRALVRVRPPSVPTFDPDLPSTSQTLPYWESTLRSDFDQFTHRQRMERFRKDGRSLRSIEEQIEENVRDRGGREGMMKRMEGKEGRRKFRCTRDASRGADSRGTKVRGLTRICRHRH